MSQWQTYFNKHQGRAPREQLLEAITFCKNKNTALDLGAGNLIETQALIDAGFKKVIAIDNAPEAEILAVALNNPKIYFKNISFKEYDFPEKNFDLINAEFALPFYGKEGFDAFFTKIKNSLKNEGIFTGQFFGEHDGWNNPDSLLVFHTKEQSLNLLKGLDILDFNEEEKDAGTASGSQKHWHIFRFIVIKT